MDLSNLSDESISCIVFGIIAIAYGVYVTRQDEIVYNHVFYVGGSVKIVGGIYISIGLMLIAFGLTGFGQ